MERGFGHFSVHLVSGVNSVATGELACGFRVWYVPCAVRPSPATAVMVCCVNVNLPCKCLLVQLSCRYIRHALVICTSLHTHAV